jgi:hypothetical protein
MRACDTPEASPLSEAILVAAKDGNMSLVSPLIAKGARSMWRASKSIRHCF